MPKVHRAIWWPARMQMQSNLRLGFQGLINAPIPFCSSHNRCFYWVHFGDIRRRLADKGASRSSTGDHGLQLERLLPRRAGRLWLGSQSTHRQGNHRRRGQSDRACRARRSLKNTGSTEDWPVVKLAATSRTIDGSSASRVMGPGQGMKGSSFDIPPFTVTTLSTTEQRWFATARGRIGYAFDSAIIIHMPVLFYITGGAAFAGLDIGSSDRTP